MNRARFAIIFGVSAIAVAAIVLLLATGGGEGPTVAGDASGDVEIGEGADAPEDTAIADVVEADVVKEGDQIVFRVRVSENIPQSLEEGSMSFRWDLYEGGDATWILAGSLDIEANASLVAQRTDYGSSTIDDTLPGSIEIDGSTLIIRLIRNDVPDFPNSFEWTFKATLDADRGDTHSATAEDRVPDEGTIAYP